MDKNILLSIIIPVYNVQDYLKECYDSIYSRDIINDIEIIIVDDGSTDNSPNICDLFSKNTNTFIYHKKNEGLGPTRNYGLSKSNGKYIMFVDSDDKIETKSLKKIINYLKNNKIDLLFLNITKFYPDGTSEDIGENIDNKWLKKDKLSAIKYLSSRDKFPASACGKVYSRDLIINNSILFPNDKRISEDMGFSFECIYKAKNYDKLDMPFYFYRKERINSITNTISIKNYKGLEKFIVDKSNEYKNKLDSIEIKYMFSFLAYEYSILLWQLNFLTNEQRKEEYTLLREYRWILKYGRSKKTKVIFILAKLFGIIITSKILYLIRGKKK